MLLASGNENMNKFPGSRHLQLTIFMSHSTAKALVKRSHKKFWKFDAANTEWAKSHCARIAYGKHIRSLCTLLQIDFSRFIKLQNVLGMGPTCL